jgi:hypothetical protein
VIEAQFTFHSLASGVTGFEIEETLSIHVPMVLEFASVHPDI